MSLLKEAKDSLQSKLLEEVYDFKRIIEAVPLPLACSVHVDPHYIGIE